MGSSSGQVIGYKYYLGMHLVLCLGADKITKITAADRTVWEGNVTTNQEIYIDKPDLFGGDKKEGGIQGYADVMFGGRSQTKNSYLTSRIRSLIPAYRGVVSLVLKTMYMTAMTQYIKPWAITATRIPAKAWYPAKSDINIGSANPAHIIYECLTDLMGYPASSIDDADFRAAADTLHAEGLGLSFMMVQDESIESFVYTVLGHCNGMMFTKQDTGKFSLVLMRDGYDVETLPHYDESNILKLESFERPAYAEMVNEIVVTYRPRGGTTDDSVTVSDLAAIQSQQGVVSQNVNYPGIDNATNANRVAMRDLRQRSTPLARIKFQVNRNAWDVTLGKVIAISWEEHGLLKIPFRVLNINYGELKDGMIHIDAVEDVFGLPTSTYIGNQPPLWDNPIKPPVASTTTRYEDATYFQLANKLEEYDRLALTTADQYLVGYLPQATQFYQNWEMWSKVGAADYIYKGTSDLTPTAKLFEGVSPVQTVIKIKDASSKVGFVIIGSFAFIGPEIVRIDAINLSTNEITVGRGCLDTTPSKHLVDVLIYFAEGSANFSSDIIPTGTALKLKALPNNGSEKLLISSAPEVGYAMGARQAKPYPPGNFKINTISYPDIISGPLILSWAHRDRLQQLVRPIIDHTVGNIGPESGVTYRISVSDETGVQSLSYTPSVTSTSWAWTTEASDVTILMSSKHKVTVSSVSGALLSHQHASWVVERTGAGYNLGNYLGSI